MKNLFLFLSSILIICVSITGYSQKSGEIKYKKEMLIPDDIFSDLKNSDPQLYKKNLGLLNRIAQATKQINYSLKFNAQESIYSADEILGKDVGLMRSLHSRTGKYYNNNKSQERLHQIENQGKTFLVNREQVSWVITDQTKVINGYSTVKATATIHSYNYRLDKDQVRDVEAWFSPEIPVSFGPEGYNGLPGLILDLKVAGERYYVTDIKLNSSELEIQKPTKGDRVSLEEYHKIINEMGERFKNFNSLN